MIQGSRAGDGPFPFGEIEMSSTLSFHIPGNLGIDVGPGSDGVLSGSTTLTDLSKFLLNENALAVLCITDDGGLFVNETTPANESTGDDVELVGTTIAENDALYVGHATVPFDQVDIQITTQGNYTTTTFAWEYWDGSSWTALSGVTDGTTAFEAAAGTVSVTFTKPTDWATTEVDSVTGYWIRARCSGTGGSTTPCQMGQLWVVAADGYAEALASSSVTDGSTWTDDTTDANDAGAGDTAVTGTHPIVGDACYIGLDERFHQVQINMGTALAGTLTVLWEYWNGSSWAALPTAKLTDLSTTFTAGTSTYLFTFAPPTDWVANTTANGPNAQGGYYFIRARISAFTSQSAQGLATQLQVAPNVTGAQGLRWWHKGDLTRVDFFADTVSGSNADSVIAIINATTGDSVNATMTKAVAVTQTDLGLSGALPVRRGDEMLIVQVTEDGTTEFADATINVLAE